MDNRYLSLVAQDLRRLASQYVRTNKEEVSVLETNIRIEIDLDIVCITGNV